MMNQSSLGELFIEDFSQTVAENIIRVFTQLVVISLQSEIGWKFFKHWQFQLNTVYTVISS